MAKWAPLAPALAAMRSSQAVNLPIAVPRAALQALRTLSLQPRLLLADAPPSVGGPTLVSAAATKGATKEGRDPMPRFLFFGYCRDSYG